MRIDYEAAYQRYQERFEKKAGAVVIGAFTKMGRHLVQRLGPVDFRPRLDTYVSLHEACKEMLESGSTISDALVHDFQEASAWVAVDPPDLYQMFVGEMGEVEDAAPATQG